MPPASRDDVRTEDTYYWPLLEPAEHPAIGFVAWTGRKEYWSAENTPHESPGLLARKGLSWPSGGDLLEELPGEKSIREMAFSELCTYDGMVAELRAYTRKSSLRCGQVAWRSLREEIELLAVELLSSSIQENIGHSATDFSCGESLLQT